MPDEPIPFGRPQLDADEIEAVTRVLSGHTLVHGPVTAKFEKAFAARVGAEHAISVSSCTAGLQLSLLANEVGPGDEVLVPAMTHVATAHAVEWCGAKPVFVDVDPGSGNIAASGVKAALGSETRAVLVVHYLGLPCDMDAIRTASDAAGCPVIEDCALAVDARYGDRVAGTLGSTGCFSFYPVKHMTTIEGGMVTTNDDALAATIRQRRAFGYDRMLGQRRVTGVYDVTELGHNFRMNEVEAAVGLAQMAKLDAFQAARKANFDRLRAALADIEEVTVFEPVQGKAVSSHYCLNAILPEDGRVDRSRVLDRLKEAGIGFSVHYPVAVPLTTYYRKRYGFSPGKFPVAEWIASQSISLPVGPHVRPEDIDRIAEQLHDSIRHARS